jgi:hypothetical protein
LKNKTEMAEKLKAAKDYVGEATIDIFANK